MGTTENVKGGNEQIREVNGLFLMCMLITVFSTVACVYLPCKNHYLIVIRLETKGFGPIREYYEHVQEI